MTRDEVHTPAAFHANVAAGLRLAPFRLSPGCAAHQPEAGIEPMDRGRVKCMQVPPPGLSVA